MQFTLTRIARRSDGVFSVMKDQDGNVIACTLEHSYTDVYGPGWHPKIYNGTFKCVRGMHRLENMISPFVTFEITGVTGHTNILFHCGNWDKDSEGCVLMGQSIDKSQGVWAIVKSRDDFNAFMANLAGVNEFDLLVSG